MWMKDIDHNSDEDGEDIIDVFQGGEEIIAYGLYSQLKLHKDHFSNMKNRYRGLSSTWFLAAFTGMGFLLSGYENIELPFNTLLGVVILCFCACFGITLLWFVDIVLYQRLWLGTVVELARLEEAHHWLPRINLNTLITRRNKKYRIFQSYFYIGLNTVFILIATITCIYYFYPNIKIVSLTGLIGIALFFLVRYLILKFSGGLEDVTTHSFR